MVFDFLPEVNNEALITVECEILKAMSNEAWKRLRKLKVAHSEDYHAWMIVILQLEKELSLKCI